MRHGLSIAARFKAVVLVIAALFTLAGAEPARGFAAPAAFGFWVLSVGAGLGLAVAAAAGLARWPAMRRRPRWQSIGLAGVIGLLLYTPLSLALEGAFGAIALPDEQDDWLDRLEASGGLSKLVAEVVQAGPLYLITWALLNVAPVAVMAAPGGSGAPSGAVAGDRKLAPAADLGSRGSRADDGRPAVALAGPDALARTEADAGASAGASASASAEVEASAPEPLAAALAEAAAVQPASARQVTAADALGWPPALGDEVLSVRADLHYLHVSTALGRATVLGTLAAVEAHFGEAGLRIHRSHWVARRAIRRVASGANGWRCELHDGQRLPISRRRVAEVRALLGRDFVLESS
jgi:hypothetical protein